VKCRVLVLTAAYPSPSEPYRAIFLENLHRELAESSDGGFSCTVVAPRVHAADPCSETRAGIDIERFDYPSGGKRLKEHDRISFFALLCYLVRAFFCVLKTARRDEYQVIVCHWILPCALVGSIARLVLGIPLVAYAHGTDVRRFVGKSSLATRLARVAPKRAAAVFAVSGELASTIRRHLAVRESRLRVLPMGVSNDFATRESASADRTESREALGLDDEHTHILFVGDFTVEKGVRELLGAGELIEKQNIPATIHVAGGGPLESELEAAPSIEVLGALPPAELAPWYRACDLFVFPSHTEGAPLVVMEALSSGLPVVSTRVGGIPELVEDGRTGLLVEPGHVHTIAEAAVRLISNHDLRATMRERLVRSIEDGSLDLTVGRTAREFRAVLDDVLTGERR